jgi:hypothetical protein
MRLCVACFVEELLLIYLIKKLKKSKSPRTGITFPYRYFFEKRFVGRLAGRSKGAYRAKSMPLALIGTAAG